MLCKSGNEKFKHGISGAGLAPLMGFWVGLWLVGPCGFGLNSHWHWWPQSLYGPPPVRGCYSVLPWVGLVVVTGACGTESVMLWGVVGHSGGLGPGLCAAQAWEVVEAPHVKYSTYHIK